MFDEKPKWLTEGIIVAAVTAFGYYMAYRYEVGYLTHFGLPPLFVTVTFERVFEMLAAITSTIIWLVFVFDGLQHDLVLGQQAHPLIAGGLALLATMLLAIFTFSIGKPWLVAILYVAVVVGTSLLYWVGGRIFKAFFIVVERSESEASALASTWLHPFFGSPYWLLIILFVSVLPIVTELAGDSYAKHQTEFITASIDGTEYALISRNGDEGLFVDVASLKTHLGQHHFVIRKIDSALPGNLMGPMNLWPKPDTQSKVSPSTSVPGQSKPKKP